MAQPGAVRRLAQDDSCFVYDDSSLHLAFVAMTRAVATIVTRLLQSMNRWHDGSAIAIDGSKTRLMLTRKYNKLGRCDDSPRRGTMAHEESWRYDDTPRRGTMAHEESWRYDDTHGRGTMAHEESWRYDDTPRIEMMKIDNKIKNLIPFVEKKTSSTESTRFQALGLCVQR